MNDFELRIDLPLTVQGGVLEIIDGLSKSQKSNFNATHTKRFNFCDKNGNAKTIYFQINLGQLVIEVR